MPMKRVMGATRTRTRIAAIVALLLLSACHGGTLDAVYPGELGHTPPPAVNLPPQDQGMGITVQP